MKLETPPAPGGTESGADSSFTSFLTPIGRVACRAALTDDESFLFQLYGTTRASEMAILPWTAEQKSAFLWHQFAGQHLYYHQIHPSAQFSVLHLDGRDIGRLYVAREEHEINVIDVALLPEWRNRGIGSALLRLVTSEANAAAKRVSLHVEANNPALRLYLRHGFHKVKDNGVYFLLEWIPGGTG